jgi:hypothetical protein
MTNLKLSTAALALIIAAPMSAFAGTTMTGPTASVDDNPREYAEPNASDLAEPNDYTDGDMQMTEQGDGDATDDIEGSMIQIGPRDNG